MKRKKIRFTGAKQMKKKKKAVQEKPTEEKTRVVGWLGAAKDGLRRAAAPSHLDLADRVSALLFPPRCMFCDELLAPGTRCAACDVRLDALALKGDARTKAGMRDKTLDNLEEVVACYEYAEDVAEAIIRYKFCGETGYYREMAQRMAQSLREIIDVKDIGLVVQVPAFQAEDAHSRLLAKRVAALLGLPFDPKALVKIAPTRKQHELGRRERELNIKNAFDVPERARVTGKRVLICDDVVTSGHTLDECARALRASGAAAVVGAAFASTFMAD
ncbi:MAG: phosphoribosyltransferase family protein [Oscillospiraceae bacterium]|nr:phosphoribosyltransferase family protein [Oscillospiraceae bacterium]